MEGGGRTGACPRWEGPLPPPLENKKKGCPEEILTYFTYVLLMKLGGGDRYTIHAKWKGVGGQALVHGGRRWGPCPPPLENEKKRLSEEILTSFAYVLQMKLGGGDRYTIHAK